MLLSGIALRYPCVERLSLSLLSSCRPIIKFPLLRPIIFPKELKLGSDPSVKRPAARSEAPKMIVRNGKKSTKSIWLSIRCPPISLSIVWPILVTGRRRRWGRILSAIVTKVGCKYQILKLRLL